jgi:hypothetical protein
VRLKSNGNITTGPGVVAAAGLDCAGLDGSGLAGAALEVTGSAGEGPAEVGATDAVLSAGEEHPATTTPSTTRKNAD